MLMMIVLGAMSIQVIWRIDCARDKDPHSDLGTYACLTMPGDDGKPRGNWKSCETIRQAWWWWYQSFGRLGAGPPNGTIFNPFPDPLSVRKAEKDDTHQFKLKPYGSPAFHRISEGSFFNTQKIL